ncbi:MAG TPA: mechanosensitive ion channel family protein [Halieaceae bacterium]|nr:mechanosensitive ion channel family protein [Halieaceae bacterium]
MWQQISESLDKTFLGNSLWQYLLAVLVILATMAAKLVARHVIDRWLARLVQRSSSELDDRLLAALRRPAFLLIYIAGLYLAVEVLTLPTEPVNLPRFFHALFTSLLIVDVAYFLYSATSILDVTLGKWAEKTETDLDDQLVPFLRRGLRVVVVALAAVMVIQNLGYSVSSLVAGLGLGGLAFALAARDTLANTFGSITIFTDRPFKLGDWIKVGSVEGVVEDIGFRSTRVRTFEKTLITIPNAKLTDTPIENVDARPLRRVKMVVGLTYDTSAEQMEQALAAIRDILGKHPGVSQDYWLVYFTDFGASSLDIFIYYFTVSKVWAEYLEVRQQVNLEIMKRLEQLGLSIAFPSTTVYLRRDTAPEG